MRESTLTLADAAATEGLGARLAKGLSAVGNAPLVIHLIGDLGAGKTTLVRGFLQALGWGGVVRSPTYTLIEPYELGARTCIHADLYRLDSPLELEHVGLRDYVLASHVLLIEWPDKGGDSTPAADLSIAIDYDGGRRSARVDAESAAGDAVIDAIWPLT